MLYPREMREPFFTQFHYTRGDGGSFLSTSF